MILHLLTDDKFADYAIQQFSALEMESEFVLIPSNGMMDLVKYKDKCTIIRQRSQEFECLLNRLGQYTGIVLHGMFWPSWQKRVILQAPSKIKIAWVFWGGEIYMQYGMDVSSYAQLTKKLFYLHNWKNNQQSKLPEELSLELYRRIDYCLTDEREEYMFAKQFTNSSFDYLWYNYYSIEETVGTLIDSQSNGHNIWLGNSAALEINHVDTLWSLYKTSRSTKNKGDVIVPLSYGVQWIRNVVLKFGKVLFGKRFHALTTYMPREEYNAVMLSCSIMIIHSWIPIAQGNIITALWLGMRVYLSERSMTYHYFRRIGCKVYSIEHDLNRMNPNVFAPMTQEDIETNRAVLRKWYSKEEMHKRNLEIVKALS